MAENNKPFGGLPSRGGTPAKRPTRKRRRVWILSGVAVAAVAVPIGITWAGVGAGPRTPQAQEITPSEVASVSEGGLCDAVDTYFAAGDAAVDEEFVVDPGTSPAVIDALADLAAIESPNQDVYRAAEAQAKDPDVAPSVEEASAIAQQFAEALQYDYSACA